MLRKTLTILSLIGLLLSVGLWGVYSQYLDEFWRRGSRIVDAFGPLGYSACR